MTKVPCKGRYGTSIHTFMNAKINEHNYVIIVWNLASRMKTYVPGSMHYFDSKACPVLISRALYPSRSTAHGFHCNMFVQRKCIWAHVALSNLMASKGRNIELQCMNRLVSRIFIVNNVSHFFVRSFPFTCEIAIRYNSFVLSTENKCICD